MGVQAFPAFSGNPADISRIQHFESNGTFTVPVGVTEVLVTALGGGGGGAGGSSGSSDPGQWGGAAGKNVYKKRLTGLIPGTNITVVVGAGGAGGAGTVSPSLLNPGNDGGATSFGSYVTASGGTGALLLSTGVYGGNENILNGENSLFAKGGWHGFVDTTGTPSIGAAQKGEDGRHGSGGGSGGNNTFSYLSGAGGNGGSGLLIVEW